ncbi:hypothetical protein LP420_40445 [Massilia sp. B-10]|nr:hypothetical protein LP420_40445 [Massilia sp. B-10]
MSSARCSTGRIPAQPGPVDPGRRPAGHRPARRQGRQDAGTHLPVRRGRAAALAPDAAGGKVGVYFGEHVFARFEHPPEPLAYQWYRHVRRLFLSHFHV